jgi:hypothetical protein
MALVFTQPQKSASRIFLVVNARPKRKADIMTAICEPIV